jgi:hypothetical protein
MPTKNLKSEPLGLTRRFAVAAKRFFYINSPMPQFWPQQCSAPQVD